MIRSWIGIVCVLVFVTTCVQTTAAQAHVYFPSTSMRNRVLPTQLRNWIELADRGVFEQILSSDDYHHDFRFRATPVKQSRNWQMPIVDVRSAKDLSIVLDAKIQNGSATQNAQHSGETNIAPVIDWVWESSSDLAVRYRELSTPLDQAAKTVIPRPLPTRAKPATQRQMLAVDARPATEFSFQLAAKSKTGSSTPKPQPSSSEYITPVVDWVWESSSDLAVRYSELNNAFDQAAMTVIPRPLSTQAKPAKQKQTLTVDARPATKFSFQLDAKRKTGPEASKSAEQKRKLIAGENDYWNYYAHCDRWNVVFAKPDGSSKGQSNSSNDEKVGSVDVPAKRKPNLDLALQGLQELAALVAHRWGDAMNFCRTLSKQFQISQN